MKLKSFSGGFVNWKFLDQSDEVFEDLQKAVRNLQELKLGFSAISFVYNARGEVENSGSGAEDCAGYLKNGRLRNLLAAASNLRILDLRFSSKFLDSPADLRYAVGRHKWEFLADVTLSKLDSRAEDLVGFCEIHAMTLRILVVETIKLVEGSWPSTFQQMRRLLNL